MQCSTTTTRVLKGKRITSLNQLEHVGLAYSHVLIGSHFKEKLEYFNTTFSCSYMYRSETYMMKAIIVDQTKQDSNVHFSTIFDIVPTLPIHIVLSQVIVPILLIYIVLGQVITITTQWHKHFLKFF